LCVRGQPVQPPTHMFRSCIYIWCYIFLLYDCLWNNNIMYIHTHTFPSCIYLILYIDIYCTIICGTIISCIFTLIRFNHVYIFDVIYWYLLYVYLWNNNIMYIHTHTFRSCVYIWCYILIFTVWLFVEQ